jgi:hypothetical protein
MEFYRYQSEFTAVQSDYCTFTSQENAVAMGRWKLYTEVPDYGLPSTRMPGRGSADSLCLFRCPRACF